MIKIIAILFAVYLGIENSFSLGKYMGFVEGARLGGIFQPIQANLNATHGSSPYGEIGNIHQYINWFLLLFVASKLIKKENLSQIISLSSIFLVFLGFIQVYNLKNSYAINEHKYFDLMRSTLQSDLIYIWLALALLIYQIVTAFRSYLDWKRNRLKVE